MQATHAHAPSNIQSGSHVRSLRHHVVCARSSHRLSFLRAREARELNHNFLLRLVHICGVEKIASLSLSSYAPFQPAFYITQAPGT